MDVFERVPEEVCVENRWYDEDVDIYAKVPESDSSMEVEADCTVALDEIIVMLDDALLRRIKKPNDIRVYSKQMTKGKPKPTKGSVQVLAD
ncbi:hypothetical protein FisN_2HuN22 [Fistulifera solaris]|uniref:Uncharacterized protein n=1 Tax=Fistulifera solaris TaxID=1519565 RepID=A0A1Z5JIZ5_FISSO|nr:hypothetical protein FisN_2HuN22 [Fistulifera solaris]|eukprot:GAX13731.1 hypothetical protein FisN_2HuN22 [Fistulifera solaris]